jgi:dihydropteroate synthase
MGVLNVTPDSFSDGGRFLTLDAALAGARAMIAEGADVIDVGGESTRPGAEPVDPQVEAERVVPVIEALAGEVRISVDTRHESVARAAVAAGATLINDITASLWPVAADTGVGWVAMHMAGDPATMQDAPSYDDVVTEVIDHLTARAEAASAAGVDEIWIDPGFGFGKTLAHNLALLAELDRIVATGWPVVVGTSRKSTLGVLTAISDARVAPARPGVTATASPPNPAPTPPDDRLEASVATATWAMVQGAQMIRVHDVRAHVHAAQVVAGHIGSTAAAA